MYAIFKFVEDTENIQILKFLYFILKQIDTCKCNNLGHLNTGVIYFESVKYIEQSLLFQ